jgi:predicted nucleic-acid-binding protein
MAALDTNVLLRWLVKDDAAQSAQAKQLIERAVRSGETLYVPITVVLELEWVLRSRYGFDKAANIGALASLLAATELSFQAETAVEIALQLFQQGKADFSDCVHIGLAALADESPLWTFDQAAAKLSGATLITA